MTTVSGVSSTSTTYSNIVTANATLNQLLTNSNFINGLALQTGNTPVSVPAVTSALWKFVDTSGAGSITLADLQNAIQSAGGIASNAYALWSQINPSGTYSMTSLQFMGSTYLQTAVNSGISTIQQNVTNALLTSSTSIAATASKTAKMLLTGNNMTTMLAMQTSPGTPPDATLTASTLWSVLNPGNAPTITLSNVQTAVKNAGGTVSDAYALWTQINPGAAQTMTERQFNNSPYVKNSINANLVTVQKNVANMLAQNPFTAVKTVQMLMNSTTVIQALATQSTRWTPPNASQVFSTLWGLFNVNSTKVITKSDVEAGVNAVGGTPSQADALWAKLDPNNTGSVGAIQFVNNSYLNDAIQVNLAKTQSNVANAQLINSGTSNTVLDSFSKGGTDILSNAATGYGSSPIGTGNNTNYLNLFV